ncbi:diaminopropionate ammonia-lyase [Martelella sp. HB161492]|uniref:diaminopropionate ammonia-lyase n=1 Tax=Martelella sp. HB161492 TaxID=2720726 RepID=UPI001AED85CE|nr:diaminopropionate ammonia-lyase [Martelella sp. HB161492]
MVFDFSHVRASLVAGHPARSVPYPPALQHTLSLDAGKRAFDTVSAWKGYGETPLVSLDALADKTGVAAIYYKHEAGRFGLGSFKALGGAYAVFRLLAARIEAATGKAPETADLLAGTYRDIVSDLTVTCATDGNHGRSVAWGAELFGCKAVIFIHETVSKAREDAIAHYGARVVRAKGNYDDSIREAARQAEEQGWFVVSDTSYPGYTDIPRNVMQGYSVMAEEAIRQLGGRQPTHIFIQGGVGGLAAAVTAHFWETFGANAPIVTVVEPENAACLQESAKAGSPVTVGGALDTIMAGLACGEPSIIAWPILNGGVSAFMAIEDEAAAETMRLLASGQAGAQLASGESGVAGLAGFLVASEHQDWREALGLNTSSVVLCFGSEGDTDPALYAEIVGQTAAEVESVK